MTREEAAFRWIETSQAELTRQNMRGNRYSPHWLCTVEGIVAARGATLIEAVERAMAATRWGEEEDD